MGGFSVDHTPAPPPLDKPRPAAAPPPPRAGPMMPRAGRRSPAAALYIAI
nr:MAG: hypothetical protein [Bacteriophage sp.]